ncbi:hypothetical protein B5807_04387 [Epicoccum nigrum]|uniref:Uncharacterized protein n=1 Tax=Epicoccum nigrum TaxID=105696 RepID=A0A1Y2M4D0_EPING|nr:hypothetical protein B5807_04387 [Epicoccum nigrum]
MAQTTASHYYQLWSLCDPPGILQESFGIVRVHSNAKSMPTQQAQQKPRAKTTKSNGKMANNSNQQQPIPEKEIKQNSGVSATMALQAAQKAWEYRQAANAAGDPDAREEILAKAINKEIEAESFGKAAKYTQSGTFQGLAAGAGLGVQPGVTIGKITGAIVGGTVSTITGLLGGGIGSVYGALNGPMWNLGEMASHGVRGVVGDFPNWKSTPAQKKALEKMVMQSKDTQAPSKEELEQMKNDMPDDMPQSWSQSVQDMTSWRPSVPSLPNMPSMSQAGSAIGLGGLGASLGLGGGKDKQAQPAARQASQQDGHAVRQAPKPQQANAPKQAPTPQEAPKPREAPKLNNTQSKTESSSANESRPQPRKSQRTSTPSKQPDASPQTSTQTSTSKPQAPKAQSSSSPKKDTEPKKAPPKLASKPQTSAPPSKPSPAAAAAKENKSPASTTASATPSANGERRKPRKLAPRSDSANSSATKKAPRKLETRRSVAA